MNTEKPKILGWRNDWGGRGDETQDLYGGTGYYRIVKPLSFLLDKYDVTHFGRAPIVESDDGEPITGNEAIIHLISKSDLVLMKNISAVHGLQLFAGVCKHFDIPLLVDMDDDYFAVDDLNPNRDYFRPDLMEQTVHKELFRAATAMTVATEPLVNAYIEFCPNQHVLPNFHDIKDWGYKKSTRQSGRIVIGWAGSSTHESDFMAVQEAFVRLWQKYGKRIIFSFCGAFPLDLFDNNLLPKEAFEIHSGTYDIWGYMPALANWGFDIGIAPIKKSRFNDGKSEGKWMEYASYKIPTVASNFGPYKRNIQDGVTGLLAETVDEWVEKLSSLIESPSLRQQIGQAAYDIVLQERQWRDHAYKWDDVFTKYIGHGFQARE